MSKLPRSFNILLHAVFFLTGIVTVLIGQVLPVLSRKLLLTDALAGYFFVAQFSGSLAGSLVHNVPVRKFGYARTVMIGLIVIVIGCFLINANNFLISAAGFVLNGIGIGITLPAINMVIAESDTVNTVSNLNILNFFWGFGAILSQPFVAFFGTETSILLPTVIINAFLAASCLLLYVVSPNGQPTALHTTEGKTFSSVSPWKTLPAWLIMIFNFLYVGLESGVGGWLTTYSTRFSEQSATALSATPVFFFLFVIGRMIAPLTTRFFSVDIFILLSLLILLAGTFSLIFVSDHNRLLVAAAITGFGASAVFPTSMARFTNIFGAEASRNVTILFMLGSLGSAFTTWLIGFVSDIYGSLRAGIVVLSVTGIILLGIQIVLLFAKPPADHSD